MGVLRVKVNDQWIDIASGGTGGNFLPLTGGTLTGPLNLNGTGGANSPVYWKSNNATVGAIFPYGTGASAAFVIQAPANNSTMALQSNQYIDLAVAGNTILQCGTQRARITGAGQQDVLRLSSDVAGINQPYIAFYTTPTETLRAGYVGRWNGEMRLVSDIEDVYIGSAAGQVVRIGTPSEFVRFKDPYVLGGITTETNPNVGGTIWRTAQYFRMTNELLNTPCFIANKAAGGNANGADMMHFRRGDNTVGAITSPAANTTNYGTTSDYRLKNVISPIQGALERLMRLHPYRATWKDDPEDRRMDAFIAHEVAEVVPEAVTGEKDAVATEHDVDELRAPSVGAIMPQQLDNSKLMPLVVAAVQELSHRLSDVEQATWE
jgi:hypothetical protein